MPFGAIGGQPVVQWVYLSHFINEENEAQESNSLEEQNKSLAEPREPSGCEIPMKNKMLGERERL